MPAQYLPDQMEMQKPQSADSFEQAIRAVIEAEIEEEAAEFEAATEFIRITDDH